MRFGKTLIHGKMSVDCTFVLLMFLTVLHSQTLAVELLKNTCSFMFFAVAPHTSRNTKQIGPSKSAKMAHIIDQVGFKMSTFLRNLRVFYGGLKPDRVVDAFWLPFGSVLAPF